MKEIKADLSKFKERTVILHKGEYSVYGMTVSIDKMQDN